MKNFLLACILLFSASGIHAQQNTWDLRRCVEYAVANNISVKQADIDARVYALRSKLAHAQIIPTLGFNTQGGVNFGRSIDPTSNQYTTQEVFFQSYGINSGVTLFNFSKLKYDIKAADALQTAKDINLNAVQNNISLSVANAYLQYLLAIESANAAKVQIQQTQSQLSNTRKLVDAGSMPELNAAQLEAQLATDSSTYISAQGQAEQQRIGLIGMLNLDATTPFEVSVPDVDKIPLEPLSEMQPDYVYKLALGNQPLQRFDSLNIVVQNYLIKSSRAAMYPTLSAFGQLSSNYASTFREFVDGALKKPSYFRQVGDINFSQAFGVQLNVPLFSNRQMRTNWESQKLTLQSYKLTQQQDNISLQTNIYQAYSASVSALQQFNATTKAYQIDQYAYDLASKRYQIGVLSTIDYITTQSLMFRAKIDQLKARYDYVFKMKILEFYKGQGVKL